VEIAMFEETADSSPFSPRKRGSERFGMTKEKNLAARIKTRPDTNREFFSKLFSPCDQDASLSDTLHG
jgi:hypothetical protein